MNAVLRKKLESSGGVPPRALQNTEFWNTLERTVAVWIQDLIGEEGQVRLQSREVSSGAALADDLFGAYIYGFHNPASEFVLAVSIDNLIAARFAAQKMQQEAADLAEAPQLFLQLLLEAPAKKLAEATTSAFQMAGAEGEMPDSISMDTMAFEGNGMLVYYLVELDGQAVRVGIALKLDAILALADSAEASQAGSPNSTRLSQPRVQNSSVQLDVVLDRLPMTIADCLRLEEGTVITLLGTDRSKLKITAETVDGPVKIADGELGVWKHQRAVRLKSPIDPDFIKEVSAA